MMGKSFTLNEAFRLADSLVLGLKKTGLPAGVLSESLGSLEPCEQILATMAIAAERIAMADTKRIGNVVPLAVFPPPDQRPLLPDSLRPALFRVIGKTQAGSVAWETLCRSVHRHLNLAGFRLHPFDLCRLEKFLKVITVKAGSYEQWYLQSLESQQPKQPAEEITWDNWQVSGKAEQIGFLRHQRTLNAEATRLAIEHDFGSASATLRQLYVEALEVGLNAGDQAFLASLATDRSGKVIEAANKLLARIPGTDAAIEKQMEIKARITTQLLTQKFTLAKQKGKKTSELLQELYALTEHIAIDEIAKALEITLEELPRKIDHELALSFAKAAAFSQNYGMALLLLPKEEEKILLKQANTITGWFKDSAHPIKRQFIEWLVPLIANAEQLTSADLLAIYELIEQPLPDNIAAILLNSKAFASACKNAVGDNQYQANSNMETLALTAVLMPPSIHQPYLSKLAEIPFRLNLDPSAYLAFISLLNQHNSQLGTYNE